MHSTKRTTTRRASLGVQWIVEALKPHSISFNRKQNNSTKTPLKEMKKKDLDTLFIVAGSAGAEKSTIIRSSFLLDIPLFGESFSLKISKNLHKPQPRRNQKILWCKRTWINFPSKTLKVSSKGPFATDLPALTHWPPKSRQSTGPRRSGQKP